MSGFAIEDQRVVNKAVETLQVDLENGHWDNRYGWLKEHDQLRRRLSIRAVQWSERLRGS